MSDPEYSSTEEFETQLFLSKQQIKTILWVE